MIKVKRLNAVLVLLVLVGVTAGIAAARVTAPRKTTTITFWDAASSNKSQTFLMVGTVFLLPIIVMYTGWSYWVFRGKVKAGAHYH